MSGEPAASFEHVVRGLAAAFLVDEPWSVHDLGARACAALGLPDRRQRWVAGLAGAVVAAFPSRPEPSAHRDLEELVARHRGLLRVYGRRVHGSRPLRVQRLFLPVDGMAPAPRFPVPSLPTDRALAEWLGTALAELDWMADRRGWLRREPRGPLQHYRYRWIGKATGERLLEAPKERLKWVQRRILRTVLRPVPPHEAAHGFRPGRSVATFAAPHAQQALVLRMDLREFFPSIGAGRVRALFEALGYPPSVAALLTGLVTTRTPESVLARPGLGVAAQDALRRRHLPQGAPTSPALSNLCAHGLDVRLQAAAAAVGARYTRYADDLAFSGGPQFRRQAGRFRLLVASVASQEGFRVRWDKNRWMPASTRQRLCGLVVNHRPRPSRADFDRLKAILHACWRQGPMGQDRRPAPAGDYRSHLRGRVAWFEHTDPARGAKLRSLFERIPWPATP
jgi:RNA-directed DNA polymerase